MNKPSPTYGTGDATFVAAGGETGIRKLVDAFFDIMGSDPAYAEIYSWHPPEREVSRDKLARFLCAWTGGPRLYNEKYGPISIPSAHSHLSVASKHRDQWLACMAQALQQCAYPQDFSEYMLEQLGVPAERVRAVCEPNLAQ
jgi:hemoglobin